MWWPRQGSVVGGPARVSRQPHGFSHSLLYAENSKPSPSLADKWSHRHPLTEGAPEKGEPPPTYPVFFFNSPLSPKTQMNTELLFKVN